MARSSELPASADGRVPGLGADVRVLYDDRAVPHIFATTTDDAWRALGFVVARDRLFQMYLQTMAASGRLTEIAGPRVISLDREMRGLGIPRAAERIAAAMKSDDPFYRAAQAYADGVNAWIGSMKPNQLPLEFRLTGTRPEPWKVVNALYLLGRMGWTLADIDNETERYAAASRVGLDAADAIFPTNPPIQEPIQPNGQRSPRIEHVKLPPPGPPDASAKWKLAAQKSFLPSGTLAALAEGGEPSNMASNNWAVSPKRSATGHALLAGDPHLDMTLPSIWYEAHLVVPGQMDVYGVTIPGAPFIVIGFNRDVAWTFTNTSTDVVDFYAETVDDSMHPKHHVVDGQQRDVASHVEVYRDAAGHAIATDTLYGTWRGPMQRIDGRWVSMRWTVLEAGREGNGFIAIQNARSAAELQEAMGRDFRAPAQNLLAADRGGRIAIRSTGRYPIRPEDGRGDVFRDGSRSSSDWQGDVPLTEYPQAFDPAQGFVASANQQPVDPRTSKRWWGGSYDPWRALRINELLRADSAMTHEKMQAFQRDPGSSRTNLLLPPILSAARNAVRGVGADSARLQRAIDLLGAWDRRYTFDNHGAVLFEQVVTELVDRTWDELLPDSGTRRIVTPATYMLLPLLADSASAWWDDRRTPAIERRDDIVAAAILAAYDGVVARNGPPGSDGWRWSNVRFANINHLLRLPALSVSKVPVQGGPGTLAPSSGSGTHGPSWRMVVELGPEIRAWTTYPGGQSGNPLSTHYRDRISDWSNGNLGEARVPHSPAELTSDRVKATLLLRGGR
jgi:penicillin amidase